MEQLLEQFKEFIVASVGSWGYWAIFVLMAAESALIPIPSEVTMPVGGLLAAEGKLSFFLVGMIGAVANLVGSWLAYWFGLAGGRSLLERYGRYILIKPHDIERADRWFQKYGGRAVFLGRLLPVIRTFISLPAGIARMKFWPFTVLTFLGCVPWSFALAYAGLVLGDNWEEILPYTEPVAYAIAGLLALYVVYWAFKRLRARRAGEAAS
ncbi:MAG: DedA family protein [Actinomycetota bacterium]